MSTVPEDERCTERATVLRFWPGQKQDRVCLEHGEDSQKVMEALGMTLALLPLFSYDGDDEMMRCACSKGHPQEVHISGTG